jgi:hypothetical protein
VAVGELCPADIGGEACKYNVNHPPAVLLSGCTKEAAAVLFEDCRIIPAGAEDEPETAILLERQAKRIMLLEAERDEAISRIKAHCKDCGKDPAQCRTCALHPYKEPERWKTVLAGNWDEVPEDE